MATSVFTSRNEMSALDLLRKKESLKVFQNASGKFYFVAGDITGYCSCRAAAEFSSGKPLEERLENLRVAEVTNTKTGQCVPCLMIKAAATMVAEATIDDLRL